MQTGLTPTDRNLLWGAGLIALLLLAGTVAFAPTSVGEASAVPSTYSSGSGGALAAYLLLVDLRYPVRRWEEPPNTLNLPGRGSLLILAEPTELPSKADRESLMHFVEGGGRILLCGSSVPAFFPDARVSFRSPEPEWKEFHSNLPTSVSRGADKIGMRPMAYWEHLKSSQIPLYGEPASPAVVAWRVGAGEILWWAAATPLTNAGITRADNLRLFLNTVTASESVEPVVIYWDEYFHGQRGSLWSYIEKTPVMWGGVQLAIFAVGLLFTFSRRSGPVVIPAAISRLSPLEFVETMGGLYQRAGAALIPVEISYRRLRFELTRRLGLPTTISDSDLAQTAGERLGFDHRLSDVLRDAALTTNQPKFPARKALDLVQRLENYVAQLHTPKALSQEKN